MSKYLDENGLLYLWGKITDAIDPKADKIPEVNHGTSDTTFTLTPNIMHIWGEVSSLTLTLPSDTNTVLDEYMFTFTCPSAAATTLTLPSTVKWIQEPNLTAGKTYQVSIINGLAGYLTDDMEISGGDENIIEEIKVNGTTQSVVDKTVNITVPQGTVTSVTVNGSNYTPDTNGLVNLGTISGGEGGSGGEYNVIEGVTFNGTSALITNKIAAITYTAPTLSKGTTTGNGNAVTDITVNGHEITLTKGTTFLTSHQDISGKANDTDVVHKTGNETITGNKTFQGQILVDNSNNYIENSSGYLVINSDTGVQITGNGLETFSCGIYSDEQIEAPSILCTTTNNRASNKFFATDGTIQTLPTGSGGEANVIETVKVNGTALVPDANKAVNISAVTSFNGSTGAITLTVPTKVSDLTNDSGFTTNAGTITGITMNGTSKGTSGVVDLGTVITSHQDISGKANNNAVVHLTGAETIAGEKTFTDGISISNGNNSTVIDLSVINGEATIRNIDLTGFDWILDSNNNSVQDVLDNKAPAEYSYTTANENYVAIGDSINQCITELDNAMATKVSSSDITSIVKITQAAYDALTTPSSTTLYIIIPASS